MTPFTKRVLSGILFSFLFFVGLLFTSDGWLLALSMGIFGGAAFSFCMYYFIDRPNK